MRRLSAASSTLAATAAGVGLALFGLGFAPQERLIWNPTGSAPTGLYWLSDGPVSAGRWAVVSARSAPAQWAQERGYVGPDWPLLKQIAGMPGDQICREGGAIAINGTPVAVARSRDSTGRALPVWQGCRVVAPTELFLLSPHPASLDGRYFGVTARSDVVGIAEPLALIAP